MKKKNSWSILTSRSVGEKVLYAFVFAAFVIYSFTLVFPVLWMIMASFKGSMEYLMDLGSTKAFSLPDKWLFSNYREAFSMLNTEKASFFGMIFNSLWYTALVTALGVLVPAVTGYVMSKYEFKGKNVIFTVAITSMVIPIVGNTASYMQVIAFFGVYDSPVYAIITSLGGFGGSFLVYYGFFKAVSSAYMEAAKIDGANPFVIFFKVMLPQGVPIMLTYAITGAIGNWNEYNTMILYLPSFPTLASGLFEYQDNAVRAINYPVYYAGLLISMIPTIALFAAFSEKIMTSLSIGGLKG